MVSLILDCSAGMSLYILKNEEVYSKIDNDQKKHTDELLLSVDNLLKDANLKVSEINNICVCVGPGSFTGIRVAISICKGLAVGANTKIFVASNFDIIEDKSLNNAVYILEGFAKYIYVRVVCDCSIKEEYCVLIDDFIIQIRDKYVMFDMIASNEKVQKMLKQYEISSNIAKNQTILHFLNKISNNQNILLEQISPIYLRASQAEIERNLKISGDK